MAQQGHGALTLPIDGSPRILLGTGQVNNAYGNTLEPANVAPGLPDYGSNYVTAPIAVNYGYFYLPWIQSAAGPLLLMPSNPSHATGSAQYYSPSPSHYDPQQFPPCSSWEPQSSYQYNMAPVAGYAAHENWQQWNVYPRGDEGEDYDGDDDDEEEEEEAVDKEEADGSENATGQSADANPKTESNYVTAKENSDDTSDDAEELPEDPLTPGGQLEAAMQNIPPEDFDGENDFIRAIVFE